MYKSNLKVAIRNILKHKGYSLINIVGLAIGTACCLLFFLWVQDELSYDRYHEKANQIFRVAFQYEANLKVMQYAGTQAPLGPALVQEFPWIQKVVRFGYQNLLVKCNNKLFYEKIFFTDPEIFDVFTFPLAIGDTKTVLKDPHSILISEEMKSKYFDRENPMGKTISLRDWGDFIITGVFKDIPRNSHFRFDFLGCFANFAKINFDKWGMYNYTTYILIANEPPIDSFKERMPQFIDKYIGKGKRKDYAFTYFLQPLTGIHLHSNIGGEIEPNRDIGTVYIFSAAALFILLIACLNYINLTAARFAERAKEVGLRKVLGAVPAQLIRQFFSESFLYALSSLPLAILLAEIFLPLSNSLWGKILSFHYFDNPFFLAGLTGIILFVGLVTGLVPALFLSALQPIDALKGRNKSGSVLTFLRRRLVVFQFTVSVLAIISTLVMVKQLHYVKTTDLGLNKENIINIAINNSEEALLKYETIKYDFLQHPSVQAVSASCFFPGQPRWNMNYIYEGLDERKNNMTGCIPVDYDFIDTFKLNIVEGRGFSKEYPTDETNAFIVNEAARKEFGWDTPIGKDLNIANWKKGTIIGVVKDFHFNSLHQKIGPAVLYIEPPHFEYFSVRVNPANVSQTIDFLKDKWQKLVPGETFEYSFLAEDFDRLYSTEIRLAKILMIIAILAIVVACLGLFGLSFFAAEQRKREIGIRKVFGATATAIAIMSAKEFARLVLVANLIAWPIAWYIMNKWLQNFAYRAGIEIWTFLLAGMISFVISLLTISYKSVRAACANPANTLRYE